MSSFFLEGEPPHARLAESWEVVHHAARIRVGGNPLIVRLQGKGAVAVDALIRMKDF